jgi:putative transposase
MTQDCDTGFEHVGQRKVVEADQCDRWIETCRHDLLDRTLIWNQRHLLHALRQYEHFYNTHRPHQGIANARPLQPLPTPITTQAQISQLHIRRHPRLGGILNEYHHAA